MIQDYFSKRLQLYPLPDKRAATVAPVLFEQYISRHGAMETLHSYQGLEFDNALMDQLCSLYDITKTRTCPYAPWSNGPVEHRNSTIKMSALRGEGWRRTSRE